MRGAVIDLGTNALRLQIVERSDGGDPVVLCRDRAPVRLGEGLFVDGRIGEPALVAAEAALGRFAELCDQYGVQRVRAVATAAVREAANRDAVVERLSAAAPVAVEVISGTEEAWLLSRAVETRVDLGTGRSLLLDLGGGSAELIRVEAGCAVAAASHPMGAVRLLERARRECGSDHGQAFVAILRQELARSDHRVRQLVGPGPVDRFVACGGNVETLAELARGQTRRPHDGASVLDCEGLDRQIDALCAASPAERAERHGLLPDRADVILPAAVVVRHLAQVAGAGRILVPGVGLRDGLQREILAAADAPDPRHDTLLASARALSERYACDAAHGERVRAHAASLFDATRALHGRPAGERVLLEAAALLHDCGRFVAGERHAEHGAYLVREGDLVGLRASECERMALAVRYHAGPHPGPADPEWGSLGAEDRAAACVLAALLRLADGLDRQHCGAVAAVELSVMGGPGRARLVLHPDANAPAGSLLELQAARDKGRLFEEVFGVELVVERAGG